MKKIILIALIFSTKISFAQGDLNYLKKNPVFSFTKGLLKVFDKEKHKGLIHATKHSLSLGSKVDHKRVFCFRGNPCPKIRVWKYLYLNPRTKKLIADDVPIATRKMFWKSRNEGRLISMGLFGNIPKYVNGPAKWLKSIKEFSIINRNSIFETFTFRIYVGKKYNQYFLREFNGKKKETFDPATREINNTNIRKLLNLGAEIVLVENDIKRFGFDATFWRFLAANEPETIVDDSGISHTTRPLRVLSRDIDWSISNLEAYTVLHWMKSKTYIQRLIPFPICISPMLAGLFGVYLPGGHREKNLLPYFSNLKSVIERYPYKEIYGDDEKFLYDKVFMRVLKDPKSDFITYYADSFGIKVQKTFASVHKGACHRPTRKHCKRNADRCIDVKIPESYLYDMSYFMKATETENLTYCSKIKYCQLKKSDLEKFRSIK